MIRLFQLRDWGLVQQLGPHSVPLNASLILLYPSSPLSAAVSHRLLQRNYPTYVWRSDENALVRGFVQLRIDKGHSQANVLWVGWKVNKRHATAWSHARIWQGLFDELAIALGKQGIQNVIAEAREDSPESDILRDIGFANYSRQDMYKLERQRRGNSAEISLLQARSTVDDWNIEKLYAHTVPNMIRLIEPHPPYGEDSWVHYEKNDLVTYAHVQSGRVAQWLNLYGNLNATADPSAMIGEIVKMMPPSPTRPLYSSVRPYQSWLEEPLKKNGFRYQDSQFIMVRHTVQAIRNPLRSLEKLMATNGATARSTPIIHKQEK